MYAMQKQGRIVCFSIDGVSHIVPNVHVENKIAYVKMRFFHTNGPCSTKTGHVHFLTWQPRIWGLSSSVLDPYLRPSAKISQIQHCITVVIGYLLIYPSFTRRLWPPICSGWGQGKEHGDSPLQVTQTACTPTRIIQLQKRDSNKAP